MKVAELGGGEALRVAIARTLALEPKLIVIDEPAATVEIAERDEVLGLLRTLAGDGLAVLASTGEAEQLAGADVALTLSDGQLGRPAARTRPCCRCAEASEARAADQRRGAGQKHRRESRGKAAMLELIDVVKRYHSGEEEVHAARRGEPAPGRPVRCSRCRAHRARGRRRCCCSPPGLSPPTPGRSSTTGATSRRWASARPRSTGSPRSG